jgi:FkbM family methyltransferase
MAISTLKTGNGLGRLEEILRKIAAEPAAAVLARERGAFDEIAGPCSNSRVLVGTGELGRKTLAGLRRAGVEPLAFADNNPRIWGSEIGGLPVLSPADAAQRHGNSACFVVTIYHGSAVRRQLADLGCRRVAPFLPLFWKYAAEFIPHTGVDLPHRLRDQFDRIQACYSLLRDETSRRELCEQLLWRYWLDYDALSPSFDPCHTYFPLDLLDPTADEVFVDCGSFDGDTVRSFSSHWQGRFRHTFAFEPDPANRSSLSAHVAELGISERVTVMPYAVGNENGCISFDLTSSAASHRVADGPAGTVECRRLDDIPWPLAPTYLKLDIEGAEPDALRGAAELLRRHHPVLAVCTYHRGEHLWDIPLLIRSISDSYAILLRRYAEECWEGVCYAIPLNRLRGANGIL